MHCPTCGKKTATLTNAVLEFVRASTEPVRPAHVVAHFGLSSQSAGNVLSYLMDRGLVYRLRHGLYTADIDQGRRALREQLDRLTPA